MPFKGTGKEAHFFRNEKNDELFNSVETAYKLFSSLLRDSNLKGIKATSKMFPEEYSKVYLDEGSLFQECKLFATRKAAERKIWKKRGSILEIGVASGAHAVSLIKETNAISYTGVDINFGQITSSCREELNKLTGDCKINLIQNNSLTILNNLAKESILYDSIYIDANHWHYFVSQELNICSKLTGKNGRIVLNDYVEWFIGSMEPCGVKRAVNEFLAANPDWCIDYFAINDCDISLIRN